MQELDTFIESNPDSRELKRALAVRMTLQGYSHREIMKILQVCSGFISKWKGEYIINGIEALKLGYKGSKGYLTQEDKKEVFRWLDQEENWILSELEYYIAQRFGVVFAAKSSYYDLFHEAGISWKKSQKKNPKKNPELVAKKKEEIENFIEKNREKIESGKLIVLFVDECHLLWGDICGYVWGKTNIRVEVEIKNQKERQTYYGALNYRTGKVTVKDYPTGDTENTIKFVNYLLSENKDSQIVIIWDGAKYHISVELREYLEKINQGKKEEEWLVKCIKLAANAPEQNPIEDVWLQGKEMLRKYWSICTNFSVVKWLFEWSINENVFHFPKLTMYGSFS